MFGKILTLSLCVAVCAALPLHGQVAPDQLTERNDVGEPLVAVVPHTDNQGFGTPRAIRVDYNKDGTLDSSDRVFLYVTGIDDFSAPVKHDKVFLFQNPNTFWGYNRPYTLAPRITILPKAGTGCVGCETTANYSSQWPYEWNGKIYMVAGVGRAQHEWREYILGQSTDGINFTWEKWLLSAPDPNPPLTMHKFAWQEITIGGVKYFYGFFDLRDGRNGRWGIAAVRYDQQNQKLWFVVGGQWEQVDTCSGETGFRFCLRKNGTWLYPDHIHTQAATPHLSFHKLSEHSNKLELWYSKAANKTSCGYDDGLGKWHNVIIYRSVAKPTSLTALPVLGAEQQLLEEFTAPVRCNPANYQHSRKTPFRLDWTGDVFYSRSWDDPIDPFGPNTTGPEGYIVRTRLGVR